MIQIAARLVSAHQFDTDSRTHSNSGSDRVFSRDTRRRVQWIASKSQLQMTVNSR